MDTIVIEQTRDYPKRMAYDPATRMFYARKGNSLSHERGVDFPYGWLKDSGTPPDEHLDVILLSSKQFALGDEAPIRIVGVFQRADGDHKLIAVEPERAEADFAELPQREKDDLSRLYPRVGPGEGWFGAAHAAEIVHAFMMGGRAGTMC